MIDFINEHKIILICLFVIFLLSAFITSCDAWTEADEVNKQLSHSADYFNVERRVTVYNARTDTVIMYIEGYISVSNTVHDELVITCKVGDGDYKKNYVYLNENTLYVIEDISGTHTDPYHYKLYINSVLFNPSIEVG